MQKFLDEFSFIKVMSFFLTNEDFAFFKLKFLKEILGDSINFS